MSGQSVDEPKFLQEMIRWEKEIAADVPSLETPTRLFLGIGGNGHGGYPCSPVDSFMFARTGMDGIHYSLLTDFGIEMDLERAPVICVSPMDYGKNVRLVAENLRDFFALWLFESELLLLNDYYHVEEYMNHKKLLSEDHSLMEQKKFVANSAKEKFGLGPITNPFEYIKELRSKRQKNIVINTKDGLGIIPENRHPNRQYFPHLWVDRNLPYDDLDSLRRFLSSADKETKLSLIRDYQHEDVYNDPLLPLLCNDLEKMGYHLEAQTVLTSSILFIFEGIGLFFRSEPPGDGTDSPLE